MKTAAVLPVLCLLLTGCASYNSFEANYLGIDAKVLALDTSIQRCPLPQLRVLEQETSLEQLNTELAREGYRVIGWSDFRSSSSAIPQSALAHGMALGACLVLYDSHFEETVTSTRTEKIPVKSYTTVETRTFDREKDKAIVSESKHNNHISASSETDEGQHTSSVTTYEYRYEERTYTTDYYRHLAVYAVRKKEP